MSGPQQTPRRSSRSTRTDSTTAADGAPLETSGAEAAAAASTPAKSSSRSRSSRSRPADAAAAAPEPAVASAAAPEPPAAEPPAAPPDPPADPAPAAAPAPAASTSPGVPPQADTGPGAPGAPSRPATPDVAAAVDKAFGRLREHLTVGEMLAGLGAIIILGVSWLLFGFLLGHFGTWPGQIELLTAAALVVVLVIQNARIHDFGPNYRLIVTGLTFVLGFQAAMDLLLTLRRAVGGSSFDIGGLTWWAGAVIAVIGGWMVWREKA